MSKWSHLPNAVHIERVLGSVRANPEKWDAAWYAAHNAAHNAAWHAAHGTILALIAWDDCAHLLDSEPEHVKLLAALGVESAILLYPACLVFSKDEELV